MPTQFKRKVVAAGTGLAIIIPVSVVRGFEVKKGDEVLITVNKGLRISFLKAKKK